MKRFLMLFVVVFVVMSVVGCATTYYMGKDPGFRNSDSPRYIFVIEPKFFSSRSPSIFVGTLKIDPYYYIVEPLFETFGKDIAVHPLSNVEEQKSEKTVFIYPVNYKMYMKLFRTNTFYDFTARVVFNDKEETIVGSYIEEKGLFPKDQTPEEAERYTREAFTDFAKKLKAFLSKTDIKKAER